MACTKNTMRPQIIYAIIFIVLLIVVVALHAATHPPAAMRSSYGGFVLTDKGTWFAAPAYLVQNPANSPGAPKPGDSRIEQAGARIRALGQSNPDFFSIHHEGTPLFLPRLARWPIAYRVEYLFSYSASSDPQPPYPRPVPMRAAIEAIHDAAKQLHSEGDVLADRVSSVLESRLLESPAGVIPATLKGSFLCWRPKEVACVVGLLTLIGLSGAALTSVVVAGVRVMRIRRRLLSRHCVHCNYPLNGVNGTSVCPECGSPRLTPNGSNQSDAR